MKINRLLILWVLFAGSLHSTYAQDDKQVIRGNSLFSPRNDSLTRKDTVIKGREQIVTAKQDSVKKHDPRIATKRSALIPGWGQAYNKQYWKIPIVYGIIAIPTVLYFYNDSYYKKTKFAYEARFKALPVNGGDSSDLANIDPQLVNLGSADLQNYRNAFRRDRDYSILWFLLTWGLQVADATVFAHLKQFDVSNDLSMQLKPLFNPVTRGPGLSLTFNLKNNSGKLPVAR